MNIEVNLDSVSDKLREKVFVLLFEATNDSMKDENVSSEMEFPETGMTSIEYLKFVDKIESTFGVIVDLEVEGNLNTVDKFVKFLQKHDVSA